MKGHYIFPKITGLELHPQMVLGHTQDSAEVQSVHSTALANKAVEKQMLHLLDTQKQKEKKINALLTLPLRLNPGRCLPLKSEVANLIATRTCWIVSLASTFFKSCQQKVFI